MLRLSPIECQEAFTVQKAVNGPGPNRNTQELTHHKREAIHEETADYQPARRRADRGCRPGPGYRTAAHRCRRPLRTDGIPYPGWRADRLRHRTRQRPVRADQGRMRMGRSSLGRHHPRPAGAQVRRHHVVDDNQRRAPPDRAVLRPVHQAALRMVRGRRQRYRHGLPRVAERQDHRRPARHVAGQLRDRHVRRRCRHQPLHHGRRSGAGHGCRTRRHRLPRLPGRQVHPVG